MSTKKSISLSSDEVKLLLSALDTSIIYLHDCNSRFKLINMCSYMKPIERGISDLLSLSKKFSDFTKKFDDYNDNLKDEFLLTHLLEFDDK